MYLHVNLYDGSLPFKPFSSSLAASEGPYQGHRRALLDLTLSY